MGISCHLFATFWAILLKITDDRTPSRHIHRRFRMYRSLLRCVYFVLWQTLPSANEVWGKVHIFAGYLSFCSWGSTWSGYPLDRYPPGRYRYTPTPTDLVSEWSVEYTSYWFGFQLVVSKKLGISSTQILKDNFTRDEFTWDEIDEPPKMILHSLMLHHIPHPLIFIFSDSVRVTWIIGLNMLFAKIFAHFFPHEVPNIIIWGFI